MKTIHFHWDVGSTNTYFALHLVKPLAARYGARLLMHPFNLGYVFRHHNYVLADEPAAKLKNRGRDLMRWAERHNLPFRMPGHFPIKTSRALRGAIAARRWDREADYIDAIFACYWERDDASIEGNSGIAAVAEKLGIDGTAFIAEAESDAVRQALIDSTNSALAAGVFGAPSFVIDGEIYWGKDRMEFVESALAR